MLQYRRWLIVTTLFSCALGALQPPARAADDATSKKYEQMVDRAIAFLGTKGQAENGSFSANQGPAVTALITTSVLRHGRSPEDPLVAKAIKFVEKFVHSDGGIYEGAYNRNYETCIAMVMFTEANRNGKYDALLKKAEAYITSSQWGPTLVKER